MMEGMVEMAMNLEKRKRVEGLLEEGGGGATTAYNFLRGVALWALKVEDDKDAR